MNKKLKLLLLAVSLVSLSIPSIGVAEEEGQGPLKERDKAAMHGGQYEPYPHEALAHTGNAAGSHVESSFPVEHNPGKVVADHIEPSGSSVEGDDMLNLTDVLEEGANLGESPASRSTFNWQPTTSFTQEPVLAKEATAESGAQETQEMPRLVVVPNFEKPEMDEIQVKDLFHPNQSIDPALVDRFDYLYRVEFIREEEKIKELEDELEGLFVLGEGEEVGQVVRYDLDNQEIVDELDFEVIDDLEVEDKMVRHISFKISQAGCYGIILK
ncbi:hypothetical protein ACWOBE_05560 [Hutsoniella sourekii]